MYPAVLVRDNPNHVQGSLALQASGPCLALVVPYFRETSIDLRPVDAAGNFHLPRPHWFRTSAGRRQITAIICSVEGYF